MIKIARPGINISVGRKTFRFIAFATLLIVGYLVVVNIDVIQARLNNALTPTFVNHEAVVILTPQTREALNILWESHSAPPSRKEFITCLTGTVTDNIITVTGSKGTNVVDFNETQIIFHSCKDIPLISPVVGIIHSHPQHVCRLSVQDKETFLESDNIIDAVQCDVDRFAFFSRQDVNNPLRLVTP